MGTLLLTESTCPLPAVSVGGRVLYAGLLVVTTAALTGVLLPPSHKAFSQTVFYGMKKFTDRVPVFLTRVSLKRSYEF